MRVDQLRSLWWNLATQVQALVGHVCWHFFGFILKFKQFLSVVGDVQIENEAFSWACVLAFFWIYSRI